MIQQIMIIMAMRGLLMDTCISKRPLVAVIITPLFIAYTIIGGGTVCTMVTTLSIHIWLLIGLTMKVDLIGHILTLMMMTTIPIRDVLLRINKCMQPSLLKMHLYKKHII